MKEIPADLIPVFEWIDAHQDEAIADLQLLVRQPSISAQKIGLRECAQLVQHIMHNDGLPADLYELEGGHLDRQWWIPDFQPQRSGKDYRGRSSISFTP